MSQSIPETQKEILTLKIAAISVGVLTLLSVPTTNNLLANGVASPLTESVVVFWTLGPGAFIGFARQLAKEKVTLRNMCGEVMTSMGVAFAAGCLLMINDTPDNPVTPWKLGFYSIAGGGLGSFIFIIGEKLFEMYGRKKLGLPYKGQSS